MSDSPIRMLALSLIQESPTNPRRTYNQAKDDELVESVSKVGVLQPVLVRPLLQDAGFELVFGHRRFRAANKAGLTHIPAMVRTMTDLEVLEAQVVENTQREDVHPLEEAEAFERLHRDHGKSADEIAAKVGKSRAYVYGRLKLCALSPAARKACYAGQIDASTALLVARIPNLEIQDQALTDIVEGDSYFGNGGPMSFRDAADHIADKYMLRLSEAPFSRTDVDLLPQAGACTTCPKRTGNQRELFSEVKSADVCTDPKCFALKKDAVWKQRVADAKAKGLTVITGKGAERATSYSGDYLSLEATAFEDTKRRTWKKLLGKKAPPVTLARTSAGKIVELVDKKAALKVLVDAGIPWAKTAARQAAYKPKPFDHAAQQRNWKIQDAVRDRLEGAIFEKVAAAVPAILKNESKLWRVLASCVSYDVDADAVLTRRGVTPAKGDRASAQLAKLIASAKLEDLKALTIECLAVGSSYRHDEISELLELAGVDAKKLEKDLEKTVTAEFKAEEQKAAAEADAKKAGSKKSKGSKRPKKKRAHAAATKVQACRVCGCTEDNACEGGCSWVEKDLCSECEGAA